MKTMLLASGALMCFGGPAFAQSVGASTDAEDIVVTGKYTIDERIDTATGLGLSVRETPQSVTVITSQRIIDQSLDTIADVAANAPGVNVQQVDDVRNTLNARGFEINDYQYDGVPVPTTLAGSQGETMVDSSIYERVEVVRGATGLLTGAGDPSASINLVRKHANKTELGGYVNLSYGSWDNYKAEADVAGALTADGRIRARVVGKYKQGESNVDFYENEKIVLYGVVEADIGDSTLLRAGASHQEGNPKGSTWGALPAFFSDNSSTDWSTSKSTAADWTFWDTENQNAFVTIQHEFTNGWEVVANYNWTRNSETTNILYLFGSVDRATGLGLGAFPYADDGDSVQNSFDIQLKGKYALFGREHEFTAGSIHSKQTLETTTFGALAFFPVTNFFAWNGGSYPFPGFSSTGTLGADIETEQTGYYAATRLNVTDKLKVIAGARLASYEQTGITFGSVINAKEDNQIIPYAGALYDLTDQHRVYASYTEIFKPQSAQDRFGDYLDPIVGKSYEIGLKSAFFNEALQTSLALFRIEQENLAQPDVGFIIPGSTPPAQASRAADGTTSEGFEFEVVGQPIQGWNVSFGYNVFEAEDATGAKVNTDFPRQTLKLFTTYEFEGGLLNNLTIGGGVNWSSKMYMTALVGDIEQDPYALVSLMARYKMTDQLSVQANVENVTNEKYFSQVGFFDQYRYGAPQNFEVSLNYAF